MHDATRLAARGLFRCWECRQEGPQEDGIVVAYAGNVLMAMHPQCMRGEIHIRRVDSSIEVEVPKLSERRVVLGGDLADSDVRIADPKSKRVEL